MVLLSLLLTAGFTDFSIGVDLVIQVHLDEIFLLLLSVEVLLHLNQRLLRPEMRLVVHRFNFFFLLLAGLFLLDLAFEEFSVRDVLIDPILLFQVRHMVRVLQRFVELIFLSFPHASDVF